MQVRLVPIGATGEPELPQLNLSQQARDVCASTAVLYSRVGFVPPWIGYLVMREDVCVGTCAFAAPPEGGAVEIAYFTFPENEGQGIATEMARQLISIARRTDSTLRIFAQTLPVPNASNHILKKLGFRLKGAVQHPEEGEVWEWQLEADS